MENGAGSSSQVRPSSLQFGHDVSVVENRVLGGDCERHGRLFNLATTSASWRTRRRRDRRLANPTSSIWPRRQRRGERPEQVPLGGGLGGLQFGHDVSVVENNAPARRDSAERRSSIWPRRQRRGEQRPGQDLVVVPEGLQFGHDVSVVENGGPLLHRGRPARLFNLATTSASWRTPGTGYGIPVMDLSSIWPRRQRRGERVGFDGRLERLESSIWPRRQRRGERAGHGRRSFDGGVFNLATTSASWRTRRP